LLFSPEHHEPLAPEEWDEARVRSRIDVIVADTLAAAQPDGRWPEHPADHDGDTAMPSGVYLGAAGIVWGLHAVGHDEPALLGGLHGRYLADPDWPGAVPGYLVGEAGILAVTARVAPEAADLDALEHAILANAEHASNELMWGATGSMVAALALHEQTAEQRFADAWRVCAGIVWDRWLPAPEPGCHLWTQDLYGTTTRYIGPGHGFAGNVTALWRGRHLLEGDRAAELEHRTMATTAALAFRDGDLANWAPTVGPLAHRNRIRTQWCHGAPGIVISLAGVAPANGSFTDLLVAGGELTWRAGPIAGGPGLCHGTAGNGLAFLALWERTGDRRWLERARRFAVHALGQVERERALRGFARHGLFTGDIGVAAMAARCIVGRAGMPAIDYL
jgi:hypothetical protein